MNKKTQLIFALLKAGYTVEVFEKNCFYHGKEFEGESDVESFAKAIKEKNLNPDLIVIKNITKNGAEIVREQDYLSFFELISQSFQKAVNVSYPTEMINVYENTDRILEVEGVPSKRILLRGLFRASNKSIFERKHTPSKKLLRHAVTVFSEYHEKILFSFKEVLTKQLMNGDDLDTALVEAFTENKDFVNNLIMCERTKIKFPKSRLLKQILLKSDQFGPFAKEKKKSIEIQMPGMLDVADLCALANRIVL